MSSLTFLKQITAFLVSVLLCAGLLSCSSPDAAPTVMQEAAAHTDTPIPPTSTLVPTDTLTPLPAATDTPVPPTPTITPTEGPKVPLVAGVVSMGVTDDKATNLAKIEQYMTEAAAQGAKLIVFPETVVLPNPGIGYASQLPSEEVMAAFENAAEPIPGETTDWLTQKASDYGMYIILGMIERDSEGKFYNASVFLGPQGWLATYRKRGLYDQMYGGNENLFYTRGEKAGIVVDSPLGKIGLTITNEILTYGPNFRQAEADLVVSVSSYPNMPDYPFEEWTAKVAQQCGCWHVAANLLGSVGYTESIGHSQIINPQGEVLADTGSAEGMVIVETGVMVDEASIPTTSQP